MKTQEEITARLGHSVVVLGLLCITLAAIIVVMINKKYYTDVEMAQEQLIDNGGIAPTEQKHDVYIPAENGIDGRKLFKQNCAVCHAAPGVAPSLAGVRDRAPSEEWLHRWIKNAEAVKKSGDPYAATLDKQYAANMSVFSYMSDSEISAIIEYINAEIK
jgi:mono/diheme cytochrome c family protein